MPSPETPDPRTGESFEAKESGLAENLPASAATVEDLQSLIGQAINSHRAVDPTAELQFRAGDDLYYVESEGLPEGVKSAVQVLTAGTNGTLEQIYFVRSGEGRDVATKRLGLVDAKDEKPLRLSREDRRAEDEHGLTEVSEAEARQLIQTIRRYGLGYSEN